MQVERRLFQMAAFPFCLNGFHICCGTMVQKAYHCGGERCAQIGARKSRLEILSDSVYCANDENYTVAQKKHDFRLSS